MPVSPTHQLLAIIQYEFRLQWRRRGMLVITLSMMVIPMISAFWVRDLLAPMQTSWAASGALETSELRRLVTLALLPIIWAPVYTILAIILPIVTADAIPRDRQNSVREVLRGLPLSNVVYLGGKLFAIWVSVLASTAAALIATGLVWWLVIGPFDLFLYLQMWLLGMAPLAMLNAGLSTLLALGQLNSRRAILIGVFISVASVFSLIQSLKNLEQRSLGDLFSIARPALFLYYFQNMQMPGAKISITPVSTAQVLATIVIGLLELLLVGMVMHAWINRREI